MLKKTNNFFGNTRLGSTIIKVIPDKSKSGLAVAVGTAAIVLVILSMSFWYLEVRREQQQEQQVVGTPPAQPPSVPSPTPRGREESLNQPFTIRLKETVTLGTLRLTFESTEFADIGEKRVKRGDEEVLIPAPDSWERRVRIGAREAHEGVNIPLHNVSPEWGFRGYRISLAMPLAAEEANTVTLVVAPRWPIREVSYGKAFALHPLETVSLGTLRLQFEYLEDRSNYTSGYPGEVQLTVSERDDELSLWVNKGRHGRQFHSYRIVVVRVHYQPLFSDEPETVTLRIDPVPVQTQVTEEEAVRIALAATSHQNLTSRKIIKRELRGNVWELRVLCGLDCGYTACVDASTGTITTRGPQYAYAPLPSC